MQIWGSCPDTTLAVSDAYGIKEHSIAELHTLVSLHSLQNHNPISTLVTPHFMQYDRSPKVIDFGCEH